MMLKNKAVRIVKLALNEFTTGSLRNNRVLEQHSSKEECQQK
uniref:Uncharacterized protein n=1 Tax=Rhizophora mucronata TaxID=61149 RepID=A0A2P2P5F0_RHIMU